MKSISFTAILVLAGAAAGLAQTPRKPLASIFQSRLAFYLPAPDSIPVSTQILNATQEDTTIGQNTWIEIKGANLTTTSTPRIWLGTDFINNQMPTDLDGTSVTVNGKPAFVYYISPTQVNVLTPIDPGNPTGPVQVQVKTQAGTSVGQSVTMQQYSLGFFAFNSDKYAAATHGLGDCVNPQNGTCYVGPPGVFSNAPTWTTPAKPGESIVLYGNGFGQVNPAIVNGGIPPATALPTNPVITLGGIQCKVDFAGIVTSGEYQFNIVVPLTAPDGDLPLKATYNGFSTKDGVFVTVKH